MSTHIANTNSPKFCFIDLHYRFSDDSHLMDAFVQNKCEKAFLSLLQSIAKTSRAQITIEIEPHFEGGLINRYRIHQQRPNKKGKMPESVKVALLTAIFLAPTTIVINGINEIVKSVVSDRLKDPIRDSLEKDKLRLEIEKLQLEINEKKKEVVEDNRIEQKLHEDSVALEIEDFRSKLIKVDSNKASNASRLRFYKELAKYSKINSVSTQIANAGYLPETEEFLVEKNDFISIGTDMSAELKKLDRAKRLFGENSDMVLEIKSKISKGINGPKGNK